MMTRRWWLVTVLALWGGCGKGSSRADGPRDFSVGFLGEHGPKLSFRLEVPKGWRVHPDPYAAVLAAPGMPAVTPTLSVTASRCPLKRGPDMERYPATGTECLEDRANAVPGSTPVRAEATPTGLRIVRTGPPGHEVALEITTLSPDERASVSCVVRGAGDVLTQARAACEGMVVQNPRD